MRFSNDLDKTIIKCVKFCSSHITPYGKCQSLYEKALDMFIRECNIDCNSFHLSWKTLYDRFNRMVSDRREENRVNQLSSGNVESRSTFEELDTMIEEIDHFEEEKEKRRTESSNQNAALVAAGAQMRLEALHRSTVRNRVEDNDDRDSDSNHTPSSTRKRLFDNSDDEEKELIFVHAERREEREKKTLRLEEDRLSIEKKRVERENEHQSRLYTLQLQRNDIDERRLELDKQRFDLDKHEREAQIENSKQMASLLNKLADKLGWLK